MQEGSRSASLGCPATWGPHLPRDATAPVGRHNQENTDSVTTTIGSSLCPLMSANSAVYDASPRPTALRPGARWRTRTGNRRTAALPARSPGPGPQPPATQVTPRNKRDAPHPETSVASCRHHPPPAASSPCQAPPPCMRIRVKRSNGPSCGGPMCVCDACALNLPAKERRCAATTRAEARRAAWRASVPTRRASMAC